MAIEHIVVHKETDYHSAFPDILRLHNGSLMVVFRQAPVRPGDGVVGDRNEKLIHEHLDSGSRIALVRSTDDGRTWNPNSHTVVDASDGSQDLNLAMISQLPCGELVINNHRWFMIPTEQRERVTTLGAQRWILSLSGQSFDEAVFDSLYFSRSSDQGDTWSEPQPVSISALGYLSHTGKNGMVKMPDGSWLLPLHGRCAADERNRVYAVRSQDGGRTWGQPLTIAYDPEQRIGFHEPAMLRLPDGTLLTVMRTDGADGYLYQAFSTDDGWTWQGLKRTAIWGFPCHLLSLRSGHILCAYGYRREPFGVRAVLSSDGGRTWDMRHETIIRSDGLHTDLGYPASVQLQDDRILSVYYFHDADGIRYIGGSIYTEADMGVES